MKRLKNYKILDCFNFLISAVELVNNNCLFRLLILSFWYSNRIQQSNLTRQYMNNIKKIVPNNIAKTSNFVFSFIATTNVIN